MTEATLRLMTMPRNLEIERVINLAKNDVEQLERQNPLSSLNGTRSRATAQSYLRQAVPQEATSVNNNRSSKTKEIKRIKKLRAAIAPGVANHQ